MSSSNISIKHPLMLAAIKYWNYINLHPKKSETQMSVIQLTVNHSLALKNGLLNTPTCMANLKIYCIVATH